MNKILKNNVGNVIKYITKLDPKTGIAAFAIGSVTYLICESASILADKAIAAGYDMELNIPGIIALKMEKSKYTNNNQAFVAA